MNEIVSNLESELDKLRQIYLKFGVMSETQSFVSPGRPSSKSARREYRASSAVGTHTPLAGPSRLGDKGGGDEFADDVLDNMTAKELDALEFAGRSTAGNGRDQSDDRLNRGRKRPASPVYRDFTDDDRPSKYLRLEPDESAAPSSPAAHAAQLPEASAATQSADASRQGDKAGDRSDEFADDVLDAMEDDALDAFEFGTNNQEGIDARRSVEQEETKIYISGEEQPKIATSFDYRPRSDDLQSEDNVVLIKSGPDSMRLTPHGNAALANVKLIVDDARGDFLLFRRHEIGAQNLKDFSSLYPGKDVFLRDNPDGFLSVGKYNELHNSQYQRDAAQAKFAAITGRPARNDLPKVIVRIDDDTFMDAEEYVNLEGGRILHGKELHVLSADGKSYHEPYTSKQRNAEYFRNITNSDQIQNALDHYVPRHTAPLPPVLVRVGNQLINGEKLVVVDYNYSPLIDSFEKHDIFLLNVKNGRPTGNYRGFSGENHYATLEQDKILGRHPETERQREASIPHVIDEFGTKMRNLPPASVDPGLLEGIRENNRQLEEAGHAWSMRYFDKSKPIDVIPSQAPSPTPPESRAAGRDTARGLNERTRGSRDDLSR
ncbi:hypothetical protein QO002_000777 [Pararhizobium capsulatum DSM 1112]|uniref:DUF3945 domain-containing protein n=1 Tax=Pararhizobium capsulatum DSM 1112 TaxID=1121113 RepID=A0ABU0BLL2_9HYPH|nr:hypothetical protein [Pararhizobium capsulatum]MDQ0318639.1 hypothetical protein [Pararhizobium capsulatum DSM 1112]